MRVNPLLWVHLQLVKGLRGVAVIAGLYAAVFVVGSLLIFRTAGLGATFAPIARGALGFSAIFNRA